MHYHQACIIGDSLSANWAVKIVCYRKQLFLKLNKNSMNLNRCKPALHGHAPANLSGREKYGCGEYTLKNWSYIQKNEPNEAFICIIFIVGGFTTHGLGLDLDNNQISREHLAQRFYIPRYAALCLTRWYSMLGKSYPQAMNSIIFRG